MKKLIISCVIFSMLFCLSPVIKADEVSPSQSELTQQLILVLTQLISQLQQQLSDIITVQNAQSAIIQSQQDTINQIAQNTSPIVTLSTPVIIQPDILTVTCSGVTTSIDDSNFKVNFTANANGGNENYGYYWIGHGLHGSSISNNFCGSVSINNFQSDKCNMADGNSFTAGSGINNSSGLFNLNQIMISEPSLNLNNMMQVFVRSGSENASAFCPIIVQ